MLMIMNIKKSPTMKTYLLTFSFLFISLSIFSQRDDKYEKIKSLKIAYITEQLNLTPDEAKAFWPIYNNYTEKLKDLHHNELGKCRRKATEDQENLTEKESLELLKKETEINEQICTIKKNMDRDLLKVISAKKILLLKNAEKEFYNKLMKQYKKSK